MTYLQESNGCGRAVQLSRVPHKRHDNDLRFLTLEYIDSSETNLYPKTWSAYDRADQWGAYVFRDLDFLQLDVFIETLSSELVGVALV